VPIADFSPTVDVGIVTIRDDEFRAVLAAFPAGIVQGEAPCYDVTGGPINKALAALVANLASREDALGNWTDALPPPTTRELVHAVTGGR
jgi:hypothetical protein